jgi:proline iminopeptidase
MKPRLLLFLITFIPLVHFAQTEQYIVTNNDTIHLKTFGSGNPLLIINGGPGLNSKGFEPLAKILGETQKAIVYDQRGTGKSNISKVDSSTITMDIMLEDIEKIRKHLGIEKWVVLGHSFGGMLASYYASKFPQQIKGLILSSSGGIDMELFSVIDILSKLSETEKDSLKYWTAKVAKGDTSYYARYQKGKFLAPAYLYNKTNVPKVAHRLTQANFVVNRLVFKNMSAIKFDCAEGLKKLDVPVLIIQGKEDIVDISIAEKAHKVFKKSSLVILDKCGHYGWLDQPADYFNAINKYLASLDS